jgi:hypothetical protein
MGRHGVTSGQQLRKDAGAGMQTYVRGGGVVVVIGRG